MQLFCGCKCERVKSIGWKRQIYLKAVKRNIYPIDFTPQPMTLLKLYFLKRGRVMKKSAFTIVLLASCLALGACSSYPTWVPDWAQIGAD